MKRLILVAALGLGACDTEYAIPEVSTVTPITAQKTEVTRSANAGVAAFRRVASRVEPVAEATCRAENSQAAGRFCDFRLVVDNRPNQPPNAFQSIGKDGRPVITFNIAMLRTAQNDDELAFILGHEAGHQIAQHINKASTQATLGGILLGGIVAAAGGSQTAVRDAANIGGSVGARAYSQTFELEADVIGTYIADRAGYNARRGARSFARFSGGGGIMSTHPPSGRRLATVNATADRIAAEKARGITPQLPRRR